MPMTMRREPEAAGGGDDPMKRIRPACVALRRGQIERLRLLGVRLEMNRSQLVRRAIDELLAQHGDRRAAAEQQRRTAAGD